MLLYWLFFRVLSRNNEFASYDRFASQLETLPTNLLKAKQKFDPQADAIASRYFNSDYMMWVGGAEMWGEVYLFSMCILEEMQWKRTRPVSSAEFFPRRAGAVGKRCSAHSGERGREMSRAG